MKKANVAIVVLTGVFTASAYAEPAEFSAADTNADGVISTTEAKEALPEVVIVDTNNDGMLNMSEVESAVPELAFEGSEESKEQSLIGQKEYDMIVKKLSGDMSDDS